VCAAASAEAGLFPGTVLGEAGTMTGEAGRSAAASPSAEEFEPARGDESAKECESADTSEPSEDFPPAADTGEPAEVVDPAEGVKPAEDGDPAEDGVPAEDGDPVDRAAASASVARGVGTAPSAALSAIAEAAEGAGTDEIGLSASRIGAGSLCAVATAAFSEASAVSRLGMAKLDQADAPPPDIADAAPAEAPAPPNPADVPPAEAPAPLNPADSGPPDVPGPLDSADTAPAEASASSDVAGPLPEKSAKPGLADVSGVVNASTGAGVIGPDAGFNAVAADGSPEAADCSSDASAGVARSPAR
jgi:hypothetical protein